MLKHARVANEQGTDNASSDHQRKDYFKVVPELHGKANSWRVKRCLLAGKPENVNLQLYNFKNLKSVKLLFDT